MSFQGQIFTPPPQSSWNWYNQASGTVTVLGNSRNIYVPKNGSASSMTGQYITAPSTPYTAIANIVCNPIDVNLSSSIFGPIMFGFTDGTKNQCIQIREEASATSWGLNVTYAANSTTLSSDLYSDAAISKFPYPMIQWYMVRDDGTNVYYYCSQDGVTWVKIVSQARTTNLTPSSLFWGANSWNSQNINITLRSWQTIPL